MEQLKVTESHREKCSKLKFMENYSVFEILVLGIFPKQILQSGLLDSEIATI